MMIFVWGFSFSFYSNTIYRKLQSEHGILRNLHIDSELVVGLLVHAVLISLSSWDSIF